MAPDPLREVAPGVLIATSRLDSTNSVVVLADPGTVGGGDAHPLGDVPGGCVPGGGVPGRGVPGRGVPGRRGVLLIDPAWEADELAALAAALSDRGLHPVAGLSTHVHHDHLLWHPGFGDVPRWASAATARLAAAHRAELQAELGPAWPEELASVFARVQPVSGSRLPWSGPTIELVEHDAHAIGHTAAWLADPSILVAGDMLSDVELPLPADDGAGGSGGSGSAFGSVDPLGDYLAGLDALAPFVERAALVVPGHGTPGTDARARLDADRRYIEAVLAGRPVDDPRLANPGMAEAHAATLRLASARH